MRWVKDELIFLMKICPGTVITVLMTLILLIVYLSALLLTSQP